MCLSFKTVRLTKTSVYTLYLHRTNGHVDDIYQYRLDENITLSIFNFTVYLLIPWYLRNGIYSFG